MKFLLLAYFLLFLLWATPTFSQIPEAAKNNFNTIIAIMEGVTISGVLSIITFLGDSLISNNIKDKLVGLFFIPRPGETIFSRISNKTIRDDRFLISEAISHYSDIIENRPLQIRDEPYYENASWYKIYIEYKKEEAVMQAQTDYLLCRDLYIETLGFLVLYASSLFLFNGFVIFSWRFTLTLFVMAVITNISAQTKMNRFVNTVIAIDLSKTQS